MGGVTRRGFMGWLPAVPALFWIWKVEEPFDPERDAVEVGPGGLTVHRNQPDRPLVDVHNLVVKRDQLASITENVVLGKDRVISPGLQRRYSKSLGPVTNEEVGAGHGALFGVPEEIAALLVKHSDQT